MQVGDIVRAKVNSPIGSNGSYNFIEGELYKIIELEPKLKLKPLTASYWPDDNIVRHGRWGDESSFEKI